MPFAPSKRSNSPFWTASALIALFVGQIFAGHPFAASSFAQQPAPATNQNPALHLPPTPPPHQAATPIPCPPANGPEADRTYPLRKAAFEAINAKHPARARYLMRCAIQYDPRDKIALHQAVYLDLDAGDGPGAIGDIDGLRALGASEPQLEAQEGYIYAEQKHYDLAKAAFRRAIETGDSDIRFQAFQALRNLGATQSNRSLDFSLDSLYLHRFDDGVFDALLRFYQRLGAHSPFRAFVGAHLLRDSASKVGLLPQIFADNALMSGAGVAFQPHTSHFAFTGEANMAYLSYAGRNNTPALVPDFRVVAGYFNILRPGPDGHLPQRLSLQANASVGFYSRYQHDVIAYLQPQENLEFARESSVSVTPFLQESIALDSNRLYYNNTLELIPGISFGLHRLAGTALRAEYVHGFYLPAGSSSANPYGSSYNDFRFGLTLQMSHPFASRGER